MNKDVEPAFDTLVHAPQRLQICATLDLVDSAEFALLRETLGVSDSVVSKHLKTLEEAGYVKVSKGVLDRRTRTWVAMTKAGRTAYRGHVAALRQIVGG
ncbi:winged helix-turn-helix domain-containing protein [Nocardioides yefusunii]|uniref:Winged helix-turn-helix domain-containing protein n=1 Tax=Nocardioides yefusunii TaxID=2500546 RepID=A0ABW1QWU4_9ACTN|nr:transcriptional regulator [Nocardioides yefusunii]